MKTLINIFRIPELRKRVFFTLGVLIIYRLGFFIPLVGVDQSALQAIEDLAAKYEALGKTLRLRHLSRDCHKLLKRAGQLMVDSDDDPDYALAVDYSVRTGVFGGGH